MIDRPRIVDDPRPTRRRHARKAGQPRRPMIEALEVRSLLSVAGSPDFRYAAGGRTPGQAIINFQGTAATAPVAQALQSDGDAVVIDTVGVGAGGGISAYDAAATRLNADGTVDTTFGTGGSVTLPSASPDNRAEAVAIQPNGDIVVVAIVEVNDNLNDFDVELYRLTPNGSLDATFGTGGVVQFGFKQGTTSLTFSAASTVAIAPDGDVVVGGYASNSPGTSKTDLAMIAAFTASGAPDATFGVNGQVLLSIAGTTPALVPDLPGVDGLAIRPDGAIDFDATVNPASTTTVENEIAVGQLTPAGAFDATFGTAGQVVFSGSTFDNAGPLAIQPDGRLIVTGGYYDPGDGQDLSIATSHFDVYRLDVDGSIDTTFGAMGEATPETSSDLSFGAGNYDGDLAQSVLVEPGGTILVGGVGAIGGKASSTIVALNADGGPVESFGTGGLDVLPTAYSYGFPTLSARGLGVQSDGEVVALTGDGVIRLLTTGSVDDFGDTGTTDLAVQLTDLAAPVVAYQAASRAGTTPATYDAIGIPGAGQTLPAPGAYDGGGIDELGVYLPSLGAFAIRPFDDASSNGAGDRIEYVGPAGIGKAIPAPADYDGSGHTEVGVYDPSIGAFVYAPDPSSRGTISFGIPGAGQSLPVPADYYGTGQDDLAVYLAASGVWAIKDPTGKTAGEEIAFGPAGIGTAIPAPADYDHSGHIELGLYLPSIAAFAYLPYNGGPAVFTAFGMAGAGQSIPMPGDYDHSGHTELAVYMPSLDAFAYRPYGGGPDVIEAFGAVGASIPFGAAGAGASGGGSPSPKAITAGGLDGYVDFVPDLAGLPKKAAEGSSPFSQEQS